MQQNAPSQGSGFEIDDILEVLERRAWWIASGAAAGLLLGLVLYLVLPPVYTASTTILVEPQEVPDAFVRSTVTLAAEERLHTLYERVTSYANLNQLIDGIGPERLDPSGKKSREALMRLIQRGLDVEVTSRRSRNSPVSVFELTFDSHDPQVAADMASEITALFIAENVKDRAQQAKATAEFLDRELERLRKEVSKREGEIQEFKQAQMGALPGQLETNLRALDRLNFELAANLEAQESTAQRIALLRRQGAGGVAGQSPLGMALEDARRRLIEAEAIYTDEHPNVRLLRAEVARLEEKFASGAGARPVTNPTLQADIQQAQLLLGNRQREEKRLRGEIAKLQERVETTPEVEQRYIDLSRDYENMIASYQDLLKKKLEASLARNLEAAQKGERFKVLRPARPPKNPSWPNLMLLLPGGLGLGLGVVGLLILTGEFRNPSFRSVKRLSRTLGLPVVASIPRIDDDRIFDAPPPKGVDRRIVIHTAPESAPAEQYRGFIPMFLEREDRRVILVTSAARGDGKSLTCLNLAASVASDCNRSVLVIDADLRRPSTHRLLGKSRKRGLSDVLRQAGSLEECVLRTEIPNLSLLPAGPSARNPLALLTDESFFKLVDHARRSYDAVFIDAPPLLPVVDARILKRMADMILFVVRADATPRDAVVRVLHELRDAAGVVFNEVSPGSYRRYYYDDAYSRYAYGEPASDEEPEADRA